MACIDLARFKEDEIMDANRRPEERGNMLVEAAKAGLVDLDFVMSLSSDEQPYVRSSVAKALPNFSSNRRILLPLLQLMCDSEIHVRGDAILALGESGDSRVTFPLINYFAYAPYELQKRIFIAFGSLRDPRAVSFLEKHKGSSDDLGDLATRAYINCHNKYHFLYSFEGEDENWRYALETEGRIHLASSSVLDQNIKILEDHGSERPQTYIVNDLGFYIGGLIDEHVQVARGGKILSAGEIWFTKQEGLWSVDYVNNRSNGYHPDPKSFVHVKNALNRAGIKFENTKFTESYPREDFCDPEFLQFYPFFKGIGLEHI